MNRKFLTVLLTLTMVLAFIPFTTVSAVEGPNKVHDTLNQNLMINQTTGNTDVYEYSEDSSVSPKIGTLTIKANGVEVSGYTDCKLKIVINTSVTDFSINELSGHENNNYHYVNINGADSYNSDLTITVKGNNYIRGIGIEDGVLTVKGENNGALYLHNGIFKGETAKNGALNVQNLRIEDDTTAQGYSAKIRGYDAVNISGCTINISEVIGSLANSAKLSISNTTVTNASKLSSTGELDIDSCNITCPEGLEADVHGTEGTGTNKKINITNSTITVTNGDISAGFIPDEPVNGSLPPSDIIINNSDVTVNCSGNVGESSGGIKSLTGDLSINGGTVNANHIYAANGTAKFNGAAKVNCSGLAATEVNSRGLAAPEDNSILAKNINFNLTSGGKVTSKTLNNQRTDLSSVYASIGTITLGANNKITAPTNGQIKSSTNAEGLHY